MIEQINKLKDSGYPIKKIASILNVSRNTVRRYVRKSEKASEVVPTGLTKENEGPAWKRRINWLEICEKRKTGYSVKQLYADYAPAISYARFCAHLRDDLGKKTEVAIRLQHNPGEKTQVDFCSGISLYDRKTGKQIKTHLFVGVLPFSSYCFATFVMDQKLPSFIRCHEKMWKYFGGVTPYVVIDNLRSGVKKAHRYDPEVNPTYCDYGNHTGFAVLPARPYTPRDKACVESNIGVIQRSFYQQVRDRKFYKLHDLNATLHQFLEQLNNQVMQDYGVSRRERFVIEAAKLEPLPNSSYELCEWRKSKVHPDCCIQIGKSFYSVPFKYCSQEVRVKLTDNTVTVFDHDTKQIACHKRSHRVGEVVSDNHHFPDSIVQNNSFELVKAKSKAESIGPRTFELVEKWLSGPRPLQHLRRTQGLFRLLDNGITSESLEYAATQALTFERNKLSYVKECATTYQQTGGNLKPCRPKRDPRYLYLRGGYDV